MSKPAWKRRALVENTAAIKRFCSKYGLVAQSYNDGYQLRVEGVLDLYPVRARYHNLTTNERGGWDDEDDLKQIMLKALPLNAPKIDSPIITGTKSLPPLVVKRSEFPPKTPRWRRLFRVVWRYRR